MCWEEYDLHAKPSLLCDIDSAMDTCLLLSWLQVPSHCYAATLARNF